MFSIVSNYTIKTSTLMLDESAPSVTKAKDLLTFILAGLCSDVKRNARLVRSVS